MASFTMAASLLGSSGAAAYADRPSVNLHHRRSLLVVAKAAAKSPDGGAVEQAREGSRRAMVLAVAAAAVCAVGQGMAAIAGEEPKPGTPEAKKKYAPVCVTMPTAKICHK